MADHTPVTSPVPTVIDPLVEKRVVLRLRHSGRLTALMDARTDLRGVHALADFVDDSVRWSA